jgi:hypothetical protein
MGVALTATAGIILWVVLWSIGGKGFDALLPALAMVLVAATLRLLARYLPARSGRRELPPPRA